MTAAELTALREARGYASAGRIQILPHARARMIQRGATPYDVRRALSSATKCVDQRADRSRDADWRLVGLDGRGNPWCCAVSFEGSLVLFTVHGA